MTGTAAAVALGASVDTLLAVYDRQAERSPDALAIAYERAPFAGTALTWRQLRTRSRTLADVLRSAGLRPGGRCAVVMVDHPDTLPAVLAVWRAGGVLVPVDGMWGSALTRSVLALSGAELVLDPAATSVEPGPGGAGRPPLPPDTAMISYTSGSTSDPKGVVLSHGQLLHAYEYGGRAVRDLLGRTPQRFGASMRMSGLGILGMNYLWPAVMGIPVVVLPELGVATAGRYWSDLDEHRVDLTYLVPPLVELLNRMAGERSAAGPLACLSGGAPLSEASQRAFQTAFDALLLNVYGLTEVSFAAFFGARGPDGLGTTSIGRPATVEARLRGADGGVVTGPGDGELELRGPAMSYGYHGNDEANAELVQDGWLRSGDLARRDEEGRYRIVGRRKDVALKGAFTVYLHEIEEAAGQLDGVLESVAVRLDLPTGEDIGLLVRPEPGGRAPDPAEVRNALVRGLGGQRAPRRVLLTARELPRLGQHKIDRRAAQALWSELTEGER